MAKKFEIRNSTAEYLTFVAEGKEQGIQVLYKDETIWATQKAMAVLFDCSADNIGLHLKNIYDTNELNKEATTEKISVVQQEGAREVRRNTLFYNLDAIISVGYRVNSIRATQFRQWCTYVIWQFSLRGYIIDKKRMENGSFIGEDYFEHLTPSETPRKHQTICRIDKKAVPFHIIMTDMIWKPMPFSILMTDDTLSSNSNWVAER